MGAFYTDGEVAGIATSDRFTAVSKMLVDTGSEFTWIPGPLLTEAGVTIAKKDLPFVMADGSTITRSTGYALLRSCGFETVDEVVFAQSGELTLLGTRTLEGFGAVADAGRKMVATAGPHPAADCERTNYTVTRD